MRRLLVVLALLAAGVLWGCTGSEDDCVHACTYDASGRPDAAPDAPAVDATPR